MLIELKEENLILTIILVCLFVLNKADLDENLTDNNIEEIKLKKEKKLRKLYLARINI